MKLFSNFPWLYALLKKRTTLYVIKYFLVGLSGYLLYLTLLIVMVEIFKLDPVLASFLSFIPNFIYSYLLSRNWVFNSKHKHFVTLSKYLVVLIIGLILNVMIMYITINWFGWWYIYSQLLVIVVVPTNNYIFNYLWVFKKKKTL